MDGEQPDVRRGHPKRLSLDPSYRQTVEVAHDLRIPHSDFLSWHPHDQMAEFALRAYDAERCGNGHHPSMVGRFGPQWRLCELCVEVDRAQTQGPMGDGKPHPGYHLTLRPVDELMEEADDGW